MAGETVRVMARVAGGHLEIEVPRPAADAGLPVRQAERATGGSPPPGVMTHGPDFASVRWGPGEVFTFSPKQRRVVEALWVAMVDGYDYVLQETLLEEAESDCGRLRDLFRDHPAWGTMIVSAARLAGRPGCYRLVPPGTSE